MKILFEKWLCKHKWKCHSKKQITEKYYNIIVGNRTDIITTEILICEHCGKIEKIQY